MLHHLHPYASSSSSKLTLLIIFFPISLTLSLAKPHLPTHLILSPPQPNPQTQSFRHHPNHLLISSSPPHQSCITPSSGSSSPPLTPILRESPSVPASTRPTTVPTARTTTSKLISPPPSHWTKP